MVAPMIPVRNEAAEAMPDSAPRSMPDSAPRSGLVVMAAPFAVLPLMQGGRSGRPRGTVEWSARCSPQDLRAGGAGGADQRGSRGGCHEEGDGRHGRRRGEAVYEGGRRGAVRAH